MAMVPKPNVPSPPEIGVRVALEWHHHPNRTLAVIIAEAIAVDRALHATHTGQLEDTLKGMLNTMGDPLRWIELQAQARELLGIKGKADGS